MSCLARTLCYIRRKKMKSLLLLFLFLVINSMVLGTLGIRKVSLELAEELRKNAESKITLESMDVNHPFEETDMQTIGNEPNVNWLNRISEIQVVSTTCIPVAGNEGSENVFTIHGYDKLEKDSPFADKVYRITEGNYPQGSKDIVVNQFLAEDNGIQAGDKIVFEMFDGTEQEAVVAGLFLSGMERSQTENVATVNRIENQIYGTADFVNKLSGRTDFFNVAVYVNNPEQLTDTKKVLENMYQDCAAIGITDNTFQKLKMMIGQTDRITFLIFVMTVTAGSMIIGLLLAMWMRSRKTEIAVLISLGISKENILSQMVLEEMILYFIAFAGAGIATKLLLPRISNCLAIMQGNSITLELSFGWQLGVLCIGLIGVVILTGIAIFPYMEKPVKETLSEMEG
ncbi:ABC transporter permease [bacterium 1xD42-62]|uniref:ABC transporter permease n=2 Tax=Parablautia muri TaxID=2320879 RepID=A0A9X5BJ84_9FIRM|nr:ABC transporter permease [Parablautia muri]